jgi:hypothetical protein
MTYFAITVKESTSSTAGTSIQDTSDSKKPDKPFEVKTHERHDGETIVSCGAIEALIQFYKELGETLVGLAGLPQPSIGEPGVHAFFYQREIKPGCIVIACQFCFAETTVDLPADVHKLMYELHGAAPDSITPISFVSIPLSPEAAAETKPAAYFVTTIGPKTDGLAQLDPESAPSIYDCLADKSPFGIKRYKRCDGGSIQSTEAIQQLLNEYAEKGEAIFSIDGLPRPSVGERGMHVFLYQHEFAPGLFRFGCHVHICDMPTNGVDLIQLLYDVTCHSLSTESKALTPLSFLSISLATPAAS